MLWHNRAGDYPLTMPGSARLAGMESARTGEPRSGGGGDRSSARSKYKPAAPRDSASDSSGIRNGRGPVHRRERWWPRGATTKAAPEEGLTHGPCQWAQCKTNPFWVGRCCVASRGQCPPWTKCGLHTGPGQNEGRYTGLAMRVAIVCLTWSHAHHDGRSCWRAMRTAKVSIQ